MTHLIHLIVSALGVYVAAYLIPGVTVTYLGAGITAIVLGLINTFIKPIIKILTLPINIVTLGLFSLVINALFVMLVARIIPDFSVSGFWTALIFSVIISLINALFLRK